MSKLKFANFNCSNTAKYTQSTATKCDTDKTKTAKCLSVATGEEIRTPKALAWHMVFLSLSIRPASVTGEAVDCLSFPISIRTLANHSGQERMKRRLALKPWTSSSEFGGFLCLSFQSLTKKKIAKSLQGVACFPIRLNNSVDTRRHASFNVSRPQVSNLISS